MENKKIILIWGFFVVFILSCNLVMSDSGRDSYNNKELEMILLNVNSYIDNINTYSAKYSIPSNILKSIIGLNNLGEFSVTEGYSSKGRIGLMDLRPFNNSGQSVHHKLCLDSDCKFTEVKDLNKLTLEKKRKAVKEDYLNTEKSICCASYILNLTHKKSQPVDFPPQACKDERSPVTYKGWNATLRRYIGKDSCESNYLYYVEKADKLISLFEDNPRVYSISYGVLRFAPSFNIKLPTLLTVYDDLPALIKDLQTMKLENDVWDKLNDFARKHAVSFTYCEEPGLNVLNHIYDRIVNAYETNETNCRYLIASKDIGPFVDNYQVINFRHSYDGLIISNPTYVVNIKNQYTIKEPDDFPMYPSNLNLSVINSDSNKKYQIKTYSTTTSGSSLTGKYDHLYILKNSSASRDKFVFEDSVGDFYDISDNNINLTSYPRCEKKYKYYLCIDTGMREQIFDWVSWDWRDSDETIKIKFAFQIPK